VEEGLAAEDAEGGVAGELNLGLAEEPDVQQVLVQGAHGCQVPTCGQRQGGGAQGVDAQHSHDALVCSCHTGDSASRSQGQCGEGEAPWSVVGGFLYSPAFWACRWWARRSEEQGGGTQVSLIQTQLLGFQHEVVQYHNLEDEDDEQELEDEDDEQELEDEDDE